MQWADIYLRLMQDRDDGPAWLALQARVRASVRTSLRQRSPDLIEDVVANTCAGVVLSLGRARGAETFAGFVLGHLLNEQRRVLKSQAAGRPGPIGLEHVNLPAPEPDEPDAPDPRTLALLKQAVAALPSREQRAVLLRYFEGASAAQIGGELGVTPGNARRILCHALACLRRWLESGRVTAAGRRCAVGLPSSVASPLPRRGMAVPARRAGKRVTSGPRRNALSGAPRVAAC